MFVISKNKTEVSVMDTDEDNLLLFNMDCNSKEDAEYLANELTFIVDYLNNQG